MSGTVQTLLSDRGRLMDNLQRLKKASRKWKQEDAERGEKTMAQLMDQVYELDRLLVRNGYDISPIQNATNQ